MTPKYRFSIFVILVVLGLMFSNGGFNTGSVAYAKKGIAPTLKPTPAQPSLASASLSLDIPSPTHTNPGYAGANTNPTKMIVKVVTDNGLLKSAFSVKIGGKDAVVIISQETSGVYTLEVMPPAQSSNGLFDLQVTAGTLTDTEVGAVNYALANNVDVELVIDRSGSMNGDKLRAAKNAAKQFVDFMHNSDMIGVVIFDNNVDTIFPLTTILPLSSDPPLFSDDMESGSGKWIADSPWALAVDSAHSGTYAWTDSPGGNYANDINISLRTASPINIPTSLTKPVLAFWQKFKIEAPSDWGYVEVSTNGGATWTTLTAGSVTGTNLTWRRVEVNLTSYKGQNALIRFRLNTNSYNPDDGWYIDDVTVGESLGIKSFAKAAIDAISARAETSIGAGLEKGQSQLSILGSSTHPWSIVLLTDGRENRTPYVWKVLPTIKASKTNVHTIGLGADVDQAMLLDIASQTGGTYNYAPSPDQLTGIYNTIVGAVANRQTLFGATGTAQQGVTDQKDVVVDSAISEATFSVSWSNSANPIDLTLRKPDGTIIDPTTAGSDPNVEYVAGSTYKYYRIHTPTLVTGTWQIRITGGSISAAPGKGKVTALSGEPYTARVAAVANLTMRSSLDRNDYLAFQSVKMVVTLSDDQPILGATVTASAVSPATINTVVDLFDDGLHGDGAANDGVYANQFAGTNMVGTYVVNFFASGMSNTGGAFTRQSQFSTYISQNLSIRQIYLPLLAR